MSSSVIIIPTRLAAKRLPGKPLLKINNIEVIIHCMQRAVEAKIGEVIIATPDKEIFDLVKKNSGNALLTSNDHASGTDRIFEAVKKLSDKNIKICINLQGDLPNFNPHDIKKLNDLMQKHKSEIGTMASVIKNNNELENTNIVKVQTEETSNRSNFVNAVNFFRKTLKSRNNNVYHHIGIYAYDIQTLEKYVNLKRTQNEIKNSLEQMRAMDNNIKINVALSNSPPLGIDTKETYVAVKKSMEYKD